MTPALVRDAVRAAETGEQNISMHGVIESPLTYATMIPCDS